MATAIEIKYCRHCGQLESMHSTLDVVNDRNIIKVWCACGAEEPRFAMLGANEPYYLQVETRVDTEGASRNDGDDQGDVLEEHEQEAEELPATAD